MNNDMKSVGALDKIVCAAVILARYLGYTQEQFNSFVGFRWNDEANIVASRPAPSRERET